MAKEIVRQDWESRFKEWIEAEKAGEQFPVPFEMVWQIAGYSRKDAATRKLPKAAQGELFHLSVEKTGRRGRPKESIRLSCDGFKHFCLMAETPEGTEIRRYFIECEKKWRMVQDVAPEFAHEIEVLRLKAAIAENEAIRAKADNESIQLRHYVTTALPEAIQQKILGYRVVEKVEYRDRIIKDDQVIRDGSTITRGQLCQQLGLMTRTGNPNYKALNRFIEQSGLPSEAWQLSAYIRENRELRREYLPKLMEEWQNLGRQQWIGE
jgi:hypothetical protein